MGNCLFYPVFPPGPEPAGTRLERCVSGWRRAAGTGSLYLLVLLDVPALGAVTPLGGVGLLAGWATLLFAGLRR